MDQQQAMAHADDIRRALIGLAIPHARSATVSVVSMSIGLSCVWPAQGGAMSILYEQADKALYQAKDLGRNRVVQWADMQ